MKRDSTGSVEVTVTYDEDNNLDTANVTARPFTVTIVQNPFEQDGTDVCSRCRL